MAKSVKDLEVNVSKLNIKAIKVNTYAYAYERKTWCSRCPRYLVPPLYSGTKGIVCYFCHEKFGDSDLVQDAKLKEYVANRTITCRWHGCDMVILGKNMSQHECSCPFRVFKCVDCSDGFMWSEAKMHIEKHGYVYLECSTIEYFADEQQNPQMKLFTIKNDEIIFVKHDSGYRYVTWDDPYDFFSLEDRCTEEYTHEFFMRVTGSHSSISGKITFRQNGRDSKPFTLIPFKLTKVNNVDVPGFKCDKLLLTKLAIQFD